MHGDISIETIFPTGYILPGYFSASIETMCCFVAYYYAIFWNAFYYQPILLTVYDRLVGRDQNTFLPLQNLIILGQVVSLLIFSTAKNRLSYHVYVNLNIDSIKLILQFYSWPICILWRFIYWLRCTWKDIWFWCWYIICIQLTLKQSHSSLVINTKIHTSLRLKITNFRFEFDMVYVHMIRILLES